MQRNESKAISLVAVGGGLAQATLRIEIGRDAAVDPDCQALIDGLTVLMPVLEPRLKFDPVPDIVGSGFGVRFRLDGRALPDTMASGSFLRSFAPAIAAREKHLDVAILRTRESATTVGHDALVFACERAVRLSRQRVTVLALSADCDLDALRPSFPTLAISASETADVLGALAGGTARFDVVVAPPAQAALVEQVTAGLAGSGPLATHQWVERGVLRSTAGLWGSDALPSLAGLLLALSRVLSEIGRTAASERLADAVLTALEDGQTTADIAVTHPYSYCHDDAGFVAAVMDRFGAVPKRVRRLSVVPADQNTDARSHMRLISASA